MALAKDRMGVDFSWMQAQGMGEFGPVEVTAAGAGTTQGTATAVSASRVRITSGAALSGVQAYNGNINDSQFFVNDASGNTIIVYPPTGNSINQLAANSGVQVPNNSALVLVKITATRHWAIGPF